jgi:serine/threonine protein phosphatase PrpC
MAGGLSLECHACAASVLADDDYCESCGAPLRREQNAEREHVEVDAGTVAGVSDRGLRHQRNEDAVFVAAAGRCAVAVVCDGVSVSAAPEVAAQVAAEVAGEWLLELVRGGTEDEVGRQAMAASLAHGGDAVAGVPWLVASERNGPSCTAVAAVWDGTAVTVGWAGDSRAYWIDGDEGQLLTVDHSWAQEQVSAGAMSPDSAEVDPRAHVITRWIGDDAPAAADTVTWTPPGPGKVVLCTDGLWNLIDGANELAVIVSSCGDRSSLAVAQRLVSTALGRGGHDNVTVAVIDVEPRER